MIFGGKRAPSFLLLGDLLTFTLSLGVTLLLRYGDTLTRRVVEDHAGPFVPLFILWALVFYMAGLYGKRVVLFKAALPNTLVSAHATNLLLSALVFFLFPSVGITPKTTLALYFLVSLALLFLWRLALYPRLSERRLRLPAALFASGREAEELASEVNGNPRYGLDFCYVAPPAGLGAPEKLFTELDRLKVKLIVVDTENAAFPTKALAPLYRATRFARRYEFATFEAVYEEVFDRVPLSTLEHGWFLENVATNTSFIYVAVKRAIDLAGALVMGLVTLVLVPVLSLANRFEGNGPLFITQQRIGERGAPISVYKFRSMREHRPTSGAWVGEDENRVTNVGAFLRRTSLDEFPQFMNVLFGELSLIGPRSDIEGLGNRLAKAISYYEARYLVRPGITGWAQVNQQYEPGNLSPQSVEETKVRLAYDFYYLKHRSLGLDLVIALKTAKRMFFRVSA